MKTDNQLKTKLLTVIPQVVWILTLTIKIIQVMKRIIKVYLKARLKILQLRKYLFKKVNKYHFRVKVVKCKVNHLVLTKNHTR